METNLESIRIIRFNELNDLLGGIHKKTILRWERAGKFPKRIKLGEKSIGWNVKDIECWIETKKLV